MRKIEFKYYWQHEETGRIINRVYSLDSLQYGDELINIPRYGLPIYRAESTQAYDIFDNHIFEKDVVAAISPEPGSPISDGFTGVVEFHDCGFWVSDGNEQHPLFQKIDMWQIVGTLVGDPDFLIRKTSPVSVPPY